MIAFPILTDYIGRKVGGIHEGKTHEKGESMKQELTMEELGQLLRAKYFEGDGPMLTTDTIIEYPDRSSIVLIERKYAPYGWAIPGGFEEGETQLLEYETTHLAHLPAPKGLRSNRGLNGRKEAHEETGLTVRLYNPDRPFPYKTKDPRATIETDVFIGKGYGLISPAQDEDAKKARIFTLEEVEELINNGGLAFKHHATILADYLQKRKIVDQLYAQQRFQSEDEEFQFFNKVWSGWYI
jgi:8-oxo-dGTP diphosphatase